MKEKDFIEDMRRSNDPFVSELFTELDKRLTYFQKESEIKRMTIKDGIPALLLTGIFFVYFLFIILS